MTPCGPNNAAWREKILLDLERHLAHLGAAGRTGLPGRHRAAALSELETALREKVQIICRGDALWPAGLEELPGMPLLFFLRGELLPADARGVGVVGSRRPSPYGLRQAERFAKHLAARGFTVVSGLARGIDAAAHRGALAAGGRTIAVLGSGLGRLYPRENLELARRIARQGAVLTEFPWESPPRQFHFPHRNRLLSALSRGVLVVEAGERSGSLITANWAVEQDRAVFALPGRADEPEARGGLRLIQDGAQLVLDPEEIVESLGGPEAQVCPAADPGADGPAAAPREEAVPENLRPASPPSRLPAPLAALFREDDAWFPDRIVERLAQPPGKVLAELSRLEAEGILRRIPGGAYTLA